MTIDEAIDFVEDINATVTFPSEAKLDEEFFANIPDWLEELKTLRYCKDKWNENQYQQGRADAIDECINSLGMVLDNENIKSELKHLFEQLKEQK